ncbi:MAG: SMC family ATPase, partial [Atribacterota bacterium]|nr:SMC family ATPase [Atribacterota bacterium]
HYEQLSLLARREVRELEKKIIALNTRLEQFQKEISEKGMVLEEIKLIEKDEERQLSIITEKRDILQKLEQENQRLSFDRRQLEEITGRISAELKELQELKERRERIEKNFKEYRALLVGEKNILSAYNIYQNLSRENQKMLLLMEEYRRMEKVKRELENHIENSKNRLKLQLEQKQEKHNDFKEKMNSLSAAKEKIKNLESQIKYFQELQKKREEIEEEGNLIKVNIESKSIQIKRLQEEIVNNQEKIALLKKGTQDFCPLCHSPLDEQKKENIELTIGQEIKQNKLKSNGLSKEIASLNEKRNILQEEWKRVRNELNRRDGVQNNLNTFTLLLKDGEKYPQQMKVLTQEINMLQDQLKQEQYALKERKSLAEIEEKIKNLNYSDEKYLEINRNLRKLKEIPVQREKLLEAKKSIIRLEEERMGVDKQYETKKISINRLKASQESLKANIGKIAELKDRITAEQEKLNQLLKEQGQLILKKGAIQEKLMKIEQFQQEQKGLEKNERKLSYQKNIYEKLSTAFGKNGIPSMIIENAIPELEEEANAILSRLSDEPITVSLESLKELQSGETRETLDIKIHDEMGVRPYELYSGGEAFRIDFAIRIALSKLLTIRAGAPLRTLVIDEGFGTQDEDGLQKLIQAINAIQNDFEKILVITHLPTLKDAFPVRIEVWKDPVLGSQFEMIHL